MTFRCAAASLDDAEPMAGTAPTDPAMLFVEHPGSWGRKAVEESRLPADVVAHLRGLGEEGVRVQLIRRHDRQGRDAGTDGGVRVFRATASPEGFAVSTAVLSSLDELPGLADVHLEPWADPLWLVCTNGRRDVCCAETGRPVAAALAERWPAATWETTHLGGHRFAGTLLALPTGVTLGRLDAGSAVAACASLEAGDLPLGLTRGTAGRPDHVQWAELHLRQRLGLSALDAVSVDRVEGASVTLRAGAAAYVLGVGAGPGPARRQSCGDESTKPATTFTLESLEQL